MFDNKVEELLYCRNVGNWERFIDLSLLYEDCMWWGFHFFDEVPEGLKYDFAVAAYRCHGDSYPKVRNAIRSLNKHPKPDNWLPDDLMSKDVITVYRGGAEPINRAKYRISWTTDRGRAEWFCNRAGLWGEHRQLYKAKIRVRDILAYTNERKEFEVMQYRKVFDIEEITPETERVNIDT